MRYYNGSPQTDQRKAYLNGVRDTAGLPYGLGEYHNGIQQTVGGVNPYSDALSAWSLLDLGTGYTGNVVRVREDSGQNEANFGFVGGLLDIAGIEAHLDIDTPDANPFVHTLYDIAGGGNDMTNSTASTQFKMGATGTVATNADGDPAMEGSLSTAYRLQKTTGIPSFGTGSFSILVTIQSDDQATHRRAFEASGSGTTINIYTHINGDAYAQLIPDGSGSIFLTSSGTSVEDGAVHKVCFVVDRTANLGKTYVDAVEANSQDISSLVGNFDPTTWRIGTTSGQYFWQYLNQVVIWNRALTAAEVAVL